MSNVERLADEISRLDPQSAGLLGAALMRALGIRLPSAIVPPAIVPPQPIEVQTEFTVWLDTADPARRVAVIRETRSLLGLGLVDSRNFVDALPKILAADVPRQ